MTTRSARSGHLSLCTGIGGLDLAIGTPTAVAETNPAASTVLAARFLGVENLGDWTQLDNLNDYTLVTGGLPCQPVSGAGKGQGDKDARYLFDDLVRLLRSSDVRPALVLENVRGLLYPRHGRIFWRFISALADLGYVGGWEVVRASDVGAPHRRERWFCVAAHPDGEPAGRHGGTAPRSQGQDEGRGQADVRDGSADGVATPADADNDRREEQPVGHRQPPSGVEVQAGNESRGRGTPALRASKYGPAVARWEHLTRPASAPLDDRDRLNPPFVEWMMGYPAGWVTDPDLGISRTEQLKMLGNAVLPQQAALALEILLGADSAEVADAA